MPLSLQPVDYQRRPSGVPCHRYGRAHPLPADVTDTEIRQLAMPIVDRDCKGGEENDARRRFVMESLLLLQRNCGCSSLELMVR